MEHVKPSPEKPVRVVLRAIPAMVDSIIRGILSDSKSIELIVTPPGGDEPECDVLLVNDTSHSWDETGSHATSSPCVPKNGIVIVDIRGDKASIFHRIGDELQLDGSVPSALEKAIQLAAGPN